MFIEDILIAAAIGVGFFFVGIPMWKLYKLINPKKSDPLADAKVRLDVAKKELEASRLNKEAEKLYDKMYNEALEEDDDSQQKKEGKL